MDAEAPFVDRPVGEESAARRLAERVAVRLGVEPPRLVRAAMNATYAADTLMVRVGRPTVDPSVAYGLADRLTDLGIRVSQPGPGRLVESDGPLSATVWQRVEEHGAVDWAEVGAMVARLHASPQSIAGSYPVPAGSNFPWWQFDTMLTRAEPLLDDVSAAALRATVDRHRGWVEASRWATPWVLCHGDVHPNNVLAGPDGPVLIDWDLMCLAPPGWDHGPLLATEARWGGEPSWYDDYAAGYGADWRHDPITVALAELRLVAATLMRVLAEGPDRSPQGEAELRLRWWRNDPDSSTWRYV